MRAIVAIVFFCAHEASAYTRHVAKLTYNDPHYQKNIYVLGDFHDEVREATPSGRASLSASNHFINSVQAQHARKPFSILWEASRETVIHSESLLFIRQKAQELHRDPSVRFVPSDTLREASSVLKAFIVDLAYDPALAWQRLQNDRHRQELVSELRRIFLGNQGNTLSNKLATLEKTGLPSPIFSFLKEKVVWHRGQMEGIVKHLGEKVLPSNKKEALLKQCTDTLAKFTADLEFLLNIFLEKDVLLGAGDGHTARIRHYLQDLRFVVEYEVKTTGLLEARHFAQLVDLQAKATLPTAPRDKQNKKVSVR